MDLISRQAAKNRKVYSDERHEYVVPVAEIDWLPSAQPEQQWTPCSEGLPKKTDFYLVTVKDWNIPQQTDFFNSHDKKWDTFGDRVIAWQPLPEPYEET